MSAPISCAGAANPRRCCWNALRPAVGPLVAGPHSNPPRPCLAQQESSKTKHPQLLYESKLYKILQGGSESLIAVCGAQQA